MTHELTATERAALHVEARAWVHAGAKEQAIVETTGLSTTRHYQLVNRLVDDRRAWEEQPVLMARIERLRTTRARGRRLTTRG